MLTHELKGEGVLNIGYQVSILKLIIDHLTNNNTFINLCVQGFNVEECK